VAVDDGIGTWGLNEKVGVAAGPIFQGGRAGRTTNEEGEGFSMMEPLGIGCIPKVVEGGDGDTC
jgi:hypothetical protein